MSSSNGGPLLAPREIYAALLRRPWPYLRHEQGEVLERWFERRNERDLVIKQNTGGGKTAAGLLIAQSSLNEGVTPVAYLAPDTYLVAQVAAEAARLSVPTTPDPRSAEFLSGEAVLVTTLQKLVNGRSIFGVAGDGRDVLRLDTVIIDDVHAAPATIEAQFRLNIPRGHDAYQPLLDLFADDLAEQSPTGWQDILDQDPVSVLRVPFWSWTTHQDQVIKILHPHRDDDVLKFNWPLVHDVLAVCAATATGAAIEIRPPCPPIAAIPAFTRARRRIYLTATLADDSVLVTDLAADAALVNAPLTPGRAADLGDRLILAPLELNPSLSADAVRKLARDFADGDPTGQGDATLEPVNVVVLVPSIKAAEAWEPYADRTYRVGDLEAGVAELRAGHVGVVVLVNKYDGVDLPGDACRLLVIDGLPRALDSAERREAAVLHGSPTLIARQVQRLEQGMGRGVRDTEDHCAVLLLGADLTHVLHDPRYRDLLSPATRAQVELSRKVSAQIRKEGLSAVVEAVQTCLGRDEDWVRLSRIQLADVHYATSGTVRPGAVALRRAFDAAATARYGAAADHVQEAITATTDLAERGWLLEQQAAYQHLIDPARAQRTLAAAVQVNPYVLRPVSGVPVARIKAAAVQGQAAAEYLSATYPDAISLVLGVRALLDQIQWDEELTENGEAALQRLGEHLGLRSERPDKRYGTGPDNLWALTASRHAVIEAKTGSAQREITKKDVNQLGGHLRWHQENYPDVAAIPVMVHPSDTCHSTATPPKGMRMITPDKLEALKVAVRAMAVALADNEGHWGSAEEVARQLTEHRLNGELLIPTYTVAARTAPSR